MSSATTHATELPASRFPAWITSFFLHGGILLAMWFELDHLPRGAAETPLRSAGIVLKRASAEGTLYEGETDSAENSVSPDSLAAKPGPKQVVEHQSQVRAVMAAAQTAQDQPPDDSRATVETNDTPAGQGGAQQGSPTGSDRYAKVSVFGVEGTGNKFVYVFDRSSSMEGAPLAAAKRQLIASLDALDSVHQFHIIFFNHRLRMFDVTAGGRRIAFGTERNKKLAANFVGGITADGGTDRFAALKQALAFQPDVIFFLTDADDPMSRSELGDLEQMYSRFGTAICVIEFGRRATRPPENFLTELAEQSGGQYGYIDAAKLQK